MLPASHCGAEGVREEGAWCNRAGARDPSPDTHFSPSKSPSPSASVTGEAGSEGEGAPEVGYALPWVEKYTLGLVDPGYLPCCLGQKPPGRALAVHVPHPFTLLFHSF